MDHQLAPGAVRTPANRPMRAKVFQSQHQRPLSPPRTPRTGLALLSNRNDNNTAVVAKPNSFASVKPAAPVVEPIEQPPPPPTTYEAPFEWEFLPDTADWLRLLGRIGRGCPGSSGLPFRGRLATSEPVSAAADYDGNKENVPPPLPLQQPPISASPSPQSSPGGHHWEESPTRGYCSLRRSRPRRRHCAGDVEFNCDSSDDEICADESDFVDEDRVAICFDIDRIL